MFFVSILADKEGRAAADHKAGDEIDVRRIVLVRRDAKGSHRIVMYADGIDNALQESRFRTDLAVDAIVLSC